MTEKLELQPNEPLFVKVERHRAVYLAAVNGEGGADMDQEANARMKSSGTRRQIRMREIRSYFT